MECIAVGGYTISDTWTMRAGSYRLSLTRVGSLWVKFNTPPIARLKNSITFALPLTPKNKVTILNNPFNEVEVRGYGFKRVLFLDMEAKKNITAVEWLSNELDNILELYPSEWARIQNAFNKAKEMEREQIIEAWCQNTWIGNEPIKDRAKQYYNETYGNK